MWRLQSRLTDERVPRPDSENTCEQVSTSNRFKWPAERRRGRGGEGGGGGDGGQRRVVTVLQ